MASVTIGPEFFAKVKLDYSNWRFAIVRELFQNSVDAGSTSINVTIFKTDHGTSLTWSNNGRPMTEDELVNKFLALGGSGKSFQNGMTGGFGAAKLLIAFCHQSYRIMTGNIVCTGSGASYELTEYPGGHMDGTETTVLIHGDEVDNLSRACAQLMSMAQWNGRLMLNGTSPAINLHRGKKRKDLSWGTIYTSNGPANTIVVRMNGIPMFRRFTDYKRTVVIELIGSSGDLLTSNRDALKSQFQSELDEFVMQLTVNRRAALKPTFQTTRQRFAGYSLAGKAKTAAAALATTSDEDATTNGFPGEKTEEILVHKNVGDRVTLTVATRPDFFILQDIPGKIPAWFIPGTMSEYSRRLITNWTNILLELADMVGFDKPFSVGFAFDEEAIGLFDEDGGKRIVYISPAIVSTVDGKPRQLKTRWKFNNRGHWDIVATAVHEFVHMLGYSSHNEAYASKVTELFGMVLANRQRFSRLFTAKTTMWS